MNMTFTEYLLEFYSDNGVYPLGFTESQIDIATDIYKARLLERDMEFVGDSVDREAVRDIVLELKREFA